MIRLSFSCLFIATLFFQACTNEECETSYTYKVYEPVYKTAEEIGADIVFVEDRILENPGKFFYYRDMILINEKDNGVHIIDNSDIQNPTKLGFIAIEGNQDISLSGQYIYADTWQNIIVIDIEDIKEPEVVNVINGVKDEIWFTGDDRFVVDIQEVERTETFNCDDNPEVFFWNNNELFVDASVDQSRFLGTPEVASVSNDGFAGDAAGQAGSLTRMALFNDHFYYINDHTMHIFDVEDLANPEKLNEVYMEWGIETIFPYRENLFIGARNGMHIFDNTQPSDPRYLSTFAHANACDPVVVQDNIAYVTLRNGNDCENFTNELNVVDVTDLLRPQLIATFDMHNPHGLSVRDEVLYLCEADQGLKVFDITEPEEIGENQIGGVRDFFAFDVISVTSELLLMIGEDGFYQFDTDSPAKPELLSSIRVGE